MTEHALRVANFGIDYLMDKYLKLVSPEEQETIPRIFLKPTLDSRIKTLSKANLIKILENAYRKRPRVFSYNPETEERIVSSFPHTLKPLDRYYGYKGVIDAMSNHFWAFANGEKGSPTSTNRPSRRWKDASSSFPRETIWQCKGGHNSLD